MQRAVVGKIARPFVRVPGFSRAGKGFTKWHQDLQIRSFGSAKSEWVFQVGREDFAEKVQDSKVPVILDCYADWCGPCRVLGPRLEKAVMKRKGALVMAKLNTDEEPDIASALEVQSLPTVLAIHDGEIVTGFIGALDEAQVEEFLDQVIDKVKK